MQVLFLADLPYESLIKLALEMGRIKDTEKKSHKIDAAYLRWEQVRRKGVPLGHRLSESRVTYKTGFEGYFVGKVRSLEELLVELLKIGEDVWKSIRLSHKTNPMKIQELKRTILSDDHYTVASVVEWSSILGAQIGRLRMNLINNPFAQSFQSDIRQAVAGLPKIEYTFAQSGPVKQRFQLPVLSETSAVLSYNGLTEEQKLHWAIVSNLGKFGHPLVRTAIEELYRAGVCI